ncbi:MAG: galactokinase [Lachnospiraceae bacterium]|nr:galactokinase [Lachnospiraceae bacterium]
MKEKMLQFFKEVYENSDDVRVFFAPGRVNLIGEHTDYNGGHVFPCALTMGTYLAIRKNGTQTCNFKSMNFDSLPVISVGIENISNKKEQGWTNYPLGIISTLGKLGYKVDEGMDFCYFGDIPNSSGLSSSASVEVVTAYALKKLFGFEYDNIEISKLSQKSENEFNGVNCGIMDQFAVAMGKKDKAIFLDTNTLDFEYVDVFLKDSKIVIANTNKKRGLGDSKYNERRSECEEALADINEGLKNEGRRLNALGELGCEEFEQLAKFIKRPVCVKRARHAVYENQRTIEAVKVLNNGDIEAFGKLMEASHDSLRDDYEVTGVELDTLVSLARDYKATGSRMTGAGFGGCSVFVVKNEYVDSLIENVGKGYLDKIGYAASFYIADIGDGPKEL